jgi:hypothetical protein
MGQFDPLFNQAAQQYGVDPNLLRAVASTESSMNPTATSTDANGNPLAMGLMQLTAATAKSLGVKDPYDPAQAIPAAAKLLRQNLDAANGDQKTALMMYHGGTDTSNWGPKTRAYPDQVYNNLAKNTQQALKASDPVYQALVGGNAATRPPAQATVAPTQAAAHNTPQGGSSPLTIHVSGGKVDPNFNLAQAQAENAASDAKAAQLRVKMGVDENGNPISGSYNAATDPVYQALTGKTPAAQAAQPVQPPQAIDPTKGMSNLDLALAGAGKSIVDLGHGAWQLGAEIGNKISPSLVSDQTVANLRAAEDARQAQDAPLMNTGMGTLGYLGGALAGTLLPGGILADGMEAANIGRGAAALRTLINPNTYKAAAASGAVMGAVQPVGSNDSRALNTVVGAGTGLAGNALVNSIGRVAQPVTNALGQVGNKAVQTLQNAGVPLDAAQQSGSAFLNRIKAGLNDNPFTAGAQRDLAGQQQGAFNRAVLGTIGENATAATPDVMNAAKTRIGQVFDDVASRNPITYDNQLQNDLAGIEQQAQGELQTGQFNVIKNKLNEVLNKAAQGNGAIDGAAYQNLKTSLDRLSKGQDQGVGYWAREMRNALDDGLQRSAQGNDYQELLQARNQWRNMRQIEGAIGSDGNGNISPNKLANIVMQKANRSQSVYGQGPQSLVDLAQSGKNVLPDQLPNSGTPARILAQMALTGGLGGGIGYLQGGDLSGAAKGATFGIAVPKMLQILMNNPAAANYLTQGMTPGAIRSILESPANNKLLAPMFKHAPNAWEQLKGQRKLAPAY